MGRGARIVRGASGGEGTSETSNVEVDEKKQKNGHISRSISYSTGGTEKRRKCRLTEVVRQFWPKIKQTYQQKKKFIIFPMDSVLPHD